jgi:hypothetical protein
VFVYADLADSEIRDKVLAALDTPKLFTQSMTAAGAGTTRVTDQLRAIGSSSASPGRQARHLRASRDRG